MQIAEIYYRARIDTAGLQQEVKRAGMTAGNTLSSSFGQRLQQMGPGLAQMGRGVGQVTQGVNQLATRAAIAGAGLGLFAVKTAASFEAAFTGVEKTVDATEAELANLEGTLHAMARSTGFAFEELAGIAETGGALGVGIDQMEEFVDVISRLAVSTDLTAESAATAMGQLRTVLQLGDGELRSVADTLVALGNAGASTEPQIVDMATRFAAAGKRAGLTADEILALSSAVASMGVDVEAGGTALSQTFNNVALAIGKGGEEVEGFTSVLGISAGEFEKRWRTDALGTFQDFLQELSKLDPIAQSVALEMAGITGQRQLNAVGLMADNYGFVGDQIEITKDKAGALNIESDKFLATTEQQWKKLKENVRDAAGTIGAELLPIVNEAMSAMVDWLSQANTQKGIKDFAKDLADGVRGLVQELRGTDFTPLLSGLRLAADTARLAFDTFRSLPGPIQQLALAALVTNKVSGGAVGNIAKGLANILGGGIKMMFPKLDFFTRGATPANALWVQMVGGLPGGPTGPTKTPLPPWAAALATAAGVAAVVALTNNGGSDNPEAQEFVDALKQRERAKDAGVSVGEQELIDSIKVAEQALRGAINSGSESEIARLNELIEQRKGELAKVQTQPTGGLNPFGLTPEQGRAALAGFARPDSGSDVALLREFGGKLDKLATTEVISKLASTTEIGLAGVGTSFQEGFKSGLDPLGDLATRILRQAEDPKSPEVMFEIKGHLQGLEELQASYLATGDVRLAEKVQLNIDTLHELIGTTDQQNAITAARAAAAASSDAAMLATAQNQTATVVSTADQARAAASSDTAMLNATGLNTQAAIHTFNASEGTRAAAQQARVSEARDAIHTLNASEGNRFLTLGGTVNTLNANEGTRAASAMALMQADTAAVHTLNANEGMRAANAMAVMHTLDANEGMRAAATQSAVHTFNASEGNRFLTLGGKVDANQAAVHTLNASEGARFSNLGVRVDASSSKAAVHSLNASEGTRFFTLGSRVGAVEGAINRMHGTLAAKRFEAVVQQTQNYYDQTGSLGGATGARNRGTVAVPHAEGSWRIPQDELAYLHRGEMVVPSTPAEWMRRMGAGESGASNVTVNLQGLVKARSVREIGTELKRMADFGYFSAQQQPLLNRSVKMR